MELTRAVYEKCVHCGDGATKIAEAVYSCDQCGTKFESHHPVMATVFKKGLPVIHQNFHFESYLCLFKWLQIPRTDYFIDIGHINFWRDGECDWPSLTQAFIDLMGLAVEAKEARDGNGAA